ncbi:MAG: Eco57I restriction-modification methylase domain-containing protein, partial [Methanosarcinales archaeon]
KMNKKDLGAVYTPQKTVEFMISLLEPIKKDSKILEPCGGDGIFVKELIKRCIDPKNITVFDIDPEVREPLTKLGVNFELRDTLKISPLEFHNFFYYAIGNPPYLSKDSKYIKENKILLRKIYKEIGVHDTYTLFIYQTLRLLKEHGLLCFIVSNTFLTLRVHNKLREYLLKNTKIKKIIITPKDLFKEVNVNTCIILLEKSHNIIENKNNVIEIVPYMTDESEYFNFKKINYIKQENFFNSPEFVFYTEVLSEILELFELPKITKELKGAVGLYTKNNKKYLGYVEGSPIVLKKRDLPIIKKEEIDGKKWRYIYKLGGYKPFYYPLSVCIKWDEDSRKTYSIPKINYFEEEGMIFSGISSRLSIRYKEKGVPWNTNKAIGYVLKKNSRFDLYYLIGLFNSNLYNYLAKGVLNTTSSLQVRDINNLPLKPYCEIDRDKMKNISEITKKIINNLKKDLTYNFTEYLKEINNLVYEIYGISEETKKIIKFWHKQKYRS